MGQPAACKGAAGRWAVTMCNALHLPFRWVIHKCLIRGLRKRLPSFQRVATPLEGHKLGRLCTRRLCGRCSRRSAGRLGARGSRLGAAEHNLAGGALGHRRRLAKASLTEAATSGGRCARQASGRLCSSRDRDRNGGAWLPVLERRRRARVSQSSRAGRTAVTARSPVVWRCPQTA